VRVNFSEKSLEKPQLSSVFVSFIAKLSKKQTRVSENFQFKEKKVAVLG